jgi:cation diffusion facilitator family transporter
MADAPVATGDLEGQLQVWAGSDAKSSEDPLVVFQAWHQKEKLSPKKKGSIRAFYETQDELAGRVLTDGCTGEDEEDLPAMAKRAVDVSFGLNVLLFVAKMVIAITSGSLAVIASTADSALDLVSGFILAHTQKLIGTPDPYNYPQGKGRLEPLGVVVFASIMGMSALMVVTESAKILVNGFMGTPPALDMGLAGYCVLGGTIVVKGGLYIYCSAVFAKTGNGAVEAYAQDHLNDVVTNTLGLVAVILATEYQKLWYLDPVAGVLMGIWILVNWMMAGQEQIALLVGKVADAHFHQLVANIVHRHSDKILEIDTVRAYHFGTTGFLVEVDIVLPENMTVRTSHDIGQTLQDKLERMDKVDRAFVHIDYESEHKPEHKLV